MLGVRNALNDRYRITYLNAQGNHYDAGRSFTLGLRFTTPH
jgi:outer membrane receptor protein involved in Fe transport